MEADAISCNVCGGTSFAGLARPAGAICTACTSNGRTRLLWLELTGRGLLRPGTRVLHIAPEAALAPRLRALLGDGYEPVDFEPDRFDPEYGVRGFDLIADAPALPSAAYDLVIHSHVMEHVAGNVTAVLYHLHRALRDDGHQVCCIPILRGRYSSEDLAPLDAAEAEARFGQADHVRQFGERDVQRTLGMIFRLPDPYDLTGHFPTDLLRRHAIPEVAWRGWSAHAVLVLAKDDLLLRG